MSITYSYTDAHRRHTGQSSTIIGWETCPGQHVPVPKALKFARMLPMIACTCCLIPFMYLLPPAAPCPGSDSDVGTFFGILNHLQAHDVQAMSGMRTCFQAFVGDFEDKACRACTVCRPSSGHVLAEVGMQPNFLAFLGNFWDTGCSLISQHFYAAFGTRCISHVKDTLGTQPNFQAFLGSFRAQCIGHFLDASWLQQGHSLGSRPCPGLVLATTGCKQIFRHTKATRCADQDTVAMQPDFQAFLGDFWDMMCRPYPGCVLATAGMQPDFQAFLGSLWAWCAGHVRNASWLRQFSGMRCVDHVWDAFMHATKAFGISRQFLGMAMFGHDVQAMSEMQDIFRHTKAARCQAMSGMQARSQAFLGYFWGTMCRPRSGRVLAMVGM
ncbi:Hypothetical predicted protein [Olea europaea subsp. europaea]|uniref:Uncharacterized protein n=1 Tax=Olea europaea subsp. europaea TaxID=158383 RepID=A0A8S0PSV4_OLEEU|nr:Hypothetical predicted protein [Olea europaea subsp. europaea]